MNERCKCKIEAVRGRGKPSFRDFSLRTYHRTIEWNELRICNSDLKYGNLSSSKAGKSANSYAAFIWMARRMICHNKSLTLWVALDFLYERSLFVSCVWSLPCCGFMASWVTRILVLSDDVSHLLITRSLLVYQHISIQSRDLHSLFPALQWDLGA